MQPAQLSLMSDHTPMPATELVAELPEVVLASAIDQLASLIAAVGAAAIEEEATGDD